VLAAAAAAAALLVLRREHWLNPVATPKEQQSERYLRSCGAVARHVLSVFVVSLRLLQPELWDYFKLGMQDS
jgi:hypothetical protein